MYACTLQMEKRMMSAIFCPYPGHVTNLRDTRFRKCENWH